MERFLLVFADYFFLVFHTVFIFFNIFGWIFRKTRKIHLATVGLTCFSWFLLGVWYGIGYCFCTDWHWIIRRKLGYYDKSRSYIHFLILEITGADFNEGLVMTVTMIVFAFIIVITLISNVIEFAGGRREK